MSDTATEYLPSVLEEKRKKETGLLLSGTEVAKRMEAIYKLVEPSVGCKLVETANVLTIAGLKGTGILYAVPLNRAQFAQISELNKYLYSLNVQYEVDEPNTNDPEVVQGSLINLNGWAYKTARSEKILKTLGIGPYDSATGFEGLEKWRHGFSVKLYEATENGVLPEDIELQIFDEGMMLGYPDQAILDFDASVREDKRDELISSMLIAAHPLAQKYSGEEPEFDFYAESYDDPEISDYIVNGRRILYEFYSSPWFSELEKSETFRAARKTNRDLIREHQKKLHLGQGQKSSDI